MSLFIAQRADLPEPTAAQLFLQALAEHRTDDSIRFASIQNFLVLILVHIPTNAYGHTVAQPRKARSDGICGLWGIVFARTADLAAGRTGSGEVVQVIIVSQRLEGIRRGGSNVNLGRTCEYLLYDNSACEQCIT